MTVLTAGETLDDLLQLTQWLSPAFPLGAFAYSHGLEVLIAQGDITDAEGVETWLSPVLQFGSGRCDGVLLSLAHRQVLPDEELATLAAALAPSKERWEETLAQGAAFAKTTNAVLGTAVAPAALPVVLGIQARRLDLATTRIIALFLQGFAANLVSVATRAVPLGQTQGQAILHRLGPAIAALASSCAEAEPEDLASAIPRAEIASMLHETAQPRLFQS